MLPRKRRSICGDMLDTRCAKFDASAHTNVAHIKPIQGAGDMQMQYSLESERPRSASVGCSTTARGGMSANECNNFGLCCKCRSQRQAQKKSLTVLWERKWQTTISSSLRPRSVEATTDLRARHQKELQSKRNFLLHGLLMVFKEQRYRRNANRLLNRSQSELYLAKSNRKIYQLRTIRSMMDTTESEIKSTNDNATQTENIEGQNEIMRDEATRLTIDVATSTAIFASNSNVDQSGDQSLDHHDNRTGDQPDEQAEEAQYQPDYQPGKALFEDHPEDHTVDHLENQPEYQTVDQPENQFGYQSEDQIEEAQYQSEYQPENQTEDTQSEDHPVDHIGNPLEDHLKHQLLYQTVYQAKEYQYQSEYQTEDHSGDQPDYQHRDSRGTQTEEASYEYQTEEDLSEQAQPKHQTTAADHGIDSRCSLNTALETPHFILGKSKSADHLLNRRRGLRLKMALTFISYRSLLRR